MSKRLFLGILSIVLGLSLFTSCSTINSIASKVQGNTIATVGSNDIYVSPGVFTRYDYAIFVKLKPTQSAVVGEIYNVDLYEKGTLRATTTVSFTQPDINIGATVTVAFPATADEENAYFMQDVSHIFSVKIHTPSTTTTAKSVLINPNQEPTLMITSPNGGEIWHIGETVNITWTSTNLAKDTPITIYLCPNYKNGGTALIISSEVANTGSYKWTVNTISELGKSYPVIGSHTRVQLMAKWGYGNVLVSKSANDFTIAQ